MAVQSAFDFSSTFQLPSAIGDPPFTDEDALVWSGHWLAFDISNTLGITFDNVWTVLTHLPDSYLRLLECPEGWVALSAIVAADLGVTPAPVIPAVH